MDRDFLAVSAFSILLVLAQIEAGCMKAKITAKAPSYGELYCNVHQKIECNKCHNMFQGVPEDVPNKKCMNCHPDYKAKGCNLSPNPHIGHHYEDLIPCSECHKIHKPDINFCNQCHSFEW